MLKRFIGMIGFLGLVATVGCGNGGNGGVGGSGSGNGSGSGSQTTGSGSSSFECCLNDAHYTCPSQAALDKCASLDSPDLSECVHKSTSCGTMSTGSSSSTGSGSSSSSGSGSGSSSTGGTTGDFGKQCTQNSDCMYNSCLIASGDQFGYCTNTCMDFTQCPTFWSCKSVGNASGMYCVQ